MRCKITSATVAKSNGSGQEKSPESHRCGTTPDRRRTLLVTAIDSTTPNSYYARKRSTLGAVVTFTAQGIPMLFQGQEMLENQQFSSNQIGADQAQYLYHPLQQHCPTILVTASARVMISKSYTGGLEGEQSSDACGGQHSANWLQLLNAGNPPIHVYRCMVTANDGNTDPNYTLEFSLSAGDLVCPLQQRLNQL